MSLNENKRLTVQEIERLNEIDVNRKYWLDDDSMSVAIEDWGLYNNNILVCKWWSREIEVDEIEEYYKLLRKKYNVDSFDEVELFCADIENDVLNFYGEHKSISSYFEAYEEYEEIDEDKKMIVSALMEHDSYLTIEKAIEKADDTRVWSNCKDVAEVACEMVEEGKYGEISEAIAMYIDYEAIARTIEINGTFLELEDNTILEVY